MEVAPQIPPPSLTTIPGEGGFTGFYESQFSAAVRLAELLVGREEVARDIA